jgi:hypothetical protein
MFKLEEVEELIVGFVLDIVVDVPQVVVSSSIILQVFLNIVSVE